MITNLLQRHYLLIIPVLQEDSYLLPLDFLWRLTFKYIFHSLFSLKEREKILKKTNLEEDQIINVLNGFSFVLIQAIAERNFPTIEKTLKENGLSSEHS